MKRLRSRMSDGESRLVGASEQDGDERAGGQRSSSSPSRRQTETGREAGRRRERTRGLAVDGGRGKAPRSLCHTSRVRCLGGVTTDEHRWRSAESHDQWWSLSLSSSSSGDRRAADRLLISPDRRIELFAYHAGVDYEWVMTIA